VAREILMARKAELQVQVLEKFIRLANQCLLLNNFNTFMEIVSGITLHMHTNAPPHATHTHARAHKTHNTQHT
jgi:hypothetical protein